MKKPILFFCFACAFLLSRAQELSLIKDINPGSAGSNVSYLTIVNNTLFFAANDGVNGMELWKSDGTAAGTILVKDINPGAGNSSIGYLANVNGTLFFVANNGINGTELWKSDGTAAGTVMVKDIRPGSMGSSPSYLVNVNGVLFFAANDGINGTELWKSDGSAAGTIMVKDINPNSGSSYPASLAAVNNTLFFAADNGVNGTELWKSDGSAAGTIMVKDIWPGITDSYPADLVNMGGTLFFSSNDGTNGTELWKSDGTAAGTMVVKDIWAGSGDAYPFNLRNIAGTLFFSADNGISGTELWKSDGTAAGTMMVKDVWPGAGSGAAGNFSELINKLVFTGNDGVNGYKTWQSDGSAAGTSMATGIVNSQTGTVQELIDTYSQVFASVSEPASGKELWGLNYTSILPLILLEFKGDLLNDDGVLNWKTEQEIKTSGFIIERSFTGNNYTPLDTVLPKNTPGIHNYTFTDSRVGSHAAEKVYYRLKQMDIDGHYSYSGVVVLSIRKSENVMLYPNPANNEINLTASAVQNEKVKCQVIDAGGKIVMQEIKELSPGSNSFGINIARLSAGTYYLNMQGMTLARQLRFIKQ